MTTIKPPPIDSRGYSELLAEATARIAVHNPEWRNHNDSDPGMTLLQLWAFMSENLLYQAALVPDRVRSKYLELLGIEVAPAVAARGMVAFDFPRGRLEMTTIPADREVLAGRVPFRTTSGLTAAPVEAQAFVKRRVGVGTEAEVQYQLLYGSLAQPGEVLDYYVTEPVVWADGPVDVSTTVDGSLWLALLARRPAETEDARRLLGGQVLSVGVVPDATLDRVILPPGGAVGSAGTDALEFHVPDTSVPLPPTQAGRAPTYLPLETRTETDVLTDPGVVQLMLPPGDRLRDWTDLEPTEAGVGRFPPELEGQEAARLVTWVRVRLAAGFGDDTAGRRPLRLTWLGINAACVEQRARVEREQVAVGTGLPDQVCHLAGTPVLRDTVELTVASERWQVVADLMEGGPEVPSTTTPSSDPTLPTRIFTLGRADGEIRFGDGLHGARPPRGAPIVVRYDVGGGQQGQVGAGAITKAPFLPAGATVTNPLPTWGGGEAPTQTEAERAIAAFVRHRDRLVSPSDFVDVVRVTPGVDIGRVEVLPLVHPDLPGQQVPGAVTLLLLPRHDPVTPDAPVPDQAFLRAVCRHVDERRLLTTELHLRGPAYEPVWVSVGIDVLPGRPVGPVRELVKAAVRAFLSPLAGGHLEGGWPLSTPVSRLELVAVVARVDGVAKVFDVLVSASGGASVEQVPMATTLHLPRLVGLEVRQGDPLPLADLQGAPDDTAPGLPVPTVPTECC